MLIWLAQKRKKKNTVFRSRQITYWVVYLVCVTTVYATVWPHHPSLPPEFSSQTKQRAICTEVNNCCHIFLTAKNCSPVNNGAQKKI